MDVVCLGMTYTDTPRDPNKTKRDALARRRAMIAELRIAQAEHLRNELDTATFRMIQTALNERIQRIEKRYA